MHNLHCVILLSEMISLKITPFIAMFLTCFNAYAASDLDSFNAINSLIDQDNYFEAKKSLDLNIESLTDTHIAYFKLILDNAFNKSEESDEEAMRFLDNADSEIPRELLFKVYQIEADNALKVYNYKRAREITDIIVNDYKTCLDADQLSDHLNSLKIYNALENVPAQTVDVHGETIIKMTTDIAGLKNLKVHIGDDSENFIFDTGANLSTTIESVAKRLNMTIIPAGIEVGSINGSKVLADLAVCPKLTIGDIDVYNSIFIVFPDKELFFAQADYQIYGILGFPIIEAFKEIHITRDGNFIVPKKETEFHNPSNMALDHLTPLVYFNQKHFTFDTGADATTLYHHYYLENKQNIDKRYQLQKLTLGGAGGEETFDGFLIDYEFDVCGKKIAVKNVQLLKEAIGDESVYGNIGQDLIQQFDEMILNFSKMQLSFK